MKAKITKLLILTFVLFIGTVSLGICENDDPFARFIKPLSNPVYFDDAQNRSYVHVVNVYQEIPKRINTTAGRVPVDGYLNLTAIRATYAFNERFSIVAAKDGYIEFKPDKTLDNGYGYGDIAAGFKYACMYDPANEFILSAKALFEFSNGSRDVFQGNGDGHVAPSFTFLKGYDKFQLMGTFGAIFPFNRSKESMEIYQSYHLSYAVTPQFFPLLELNHFRVVSAPDSRRGLVEKIVKFEGGDVINLGAENAMKKRDFISLAAGFRYRIIDSPCGKHFDLGLAYELPLTNPNNGLMQRRCNFDLVLYF